MRPLRALLRELARVLRSELRLQEFCRGLMGRTEPLARDMDHIRAFASTIDLISLCLFLAVMPNARSDKKDLAQVSYEVLYYYLIEVGWGSVKKFLFFFVNILAKFQS